MSGRLKRSQPETKTPQQTPQQTPQRTARILPVDPPDEPAPTLTAQGQAQSTKEVTMAEKDEAQVQEDQQGQEDQERTDASGRKLHPWEVSPAEQAHAIPLVEEAREGAQQEQGVEREVEVEQETASNSAQHGDAPA